MGYKLPERVARITFEGQTFDGAEVVLSLKVPMGAFLEAQTMRDTGDAKALFAFLASVLKEWNLEDGDGPIPATYDGLMRIDDAGFITALMDGWTRAVASVPDPLGGASSNGAPPKVPAGTQMGVLA